jgi:hypothetical protein
MFRTGSVSIDSVNFPLDVDGKVHQLGNKFSQSLAEYGFSSGFSELANSHDILPLVGRRDIDRKLIFWGILNTRQKL